MSEVTRIDRLLEPGSPVYTVADGATIATAAREMRKHRVGCLIVVDEPGHVVGILSERDVTHKAVAAGADAETTTVAQIMSPNVVSCTLHTEIREAQQLMARHGMRHLPVVEHGAPVGMISTRDLIKHELSTARAVAARQSRLLQQLEQANPGITELRKDASGRIII